MELNLENPNLHITWRIIETDVNTKQVLRDTTQENVITGSGLYFFAQALYSGVLATYGSNQYVRVPWYLALGTGNASPSPADTSLTTLTASSVQTGDISQSGPSVTYHVMYMPAQANVPGNTPYTEAGIYDFCTVNSSTGAANDYNTGYLMNHLLITPVIAKDDTKLLDFYVTVQFS